MAEQNAWQFHRMDGAKMDHLAFRRSVVVGLLETNKKTKKRGPVRPSGQMYDHARFNHLDHFVTSQTRCGFRHKKHSLGAKSAMLLCIQNTVLLHIIYFC
jgi:hypothetical protein